MRFPLYAKILLWFFLNLVLLAAAGWLFARAQFRFGLDSLLGGRAGDRVQAVANVIMAEVRETPRAEWDAVLARFSQAYQLQFILFRNDGAHLAGPDLPLPPEVQERVVERRFLPPGRPPGSEPPPGQSKGPLRGAPFESEIRPDGSPFDGVRPEGSAVTYSPPPGGPPGPQPRFMLQTRDPTRYWVGVRLPLVDRELRRGVPLTLLIVSDTLRGGGLFFDFTPWLIVGAGAILCSVLFWIPLVRGITRTVSQMTVATERIAEGNFDARVASRRNDELGSLAGAINRMAARLAGFVSGQKRFLGDIAHELCAPIARIQMALGILEQRAGPEQRACVEDLREEVQHMSALVNELLSFSKAGLRQKELKLESVDLAEVARRVVAREAPDGAGVRVAVPAGLQAQAETELLTRALANLVRNALRYAGHAGPITISAVREGDRVTLTVADSGPGVPEEVLQQIFDPFFRLDASRNRDTGGVGLGLAIVKTCIEACQGTLSARNRQPHGLQVDVTMRAI
jgi:two-component system sensor histidine kinase CpxA